MTLVVICGFISALLTGITFYFGGFYVDIGFLWLVPVLLFAYFWGAFAVYAVYVIGMGLKYQRSPRRYAPNRFGMWFLSQTCFMVLLITRCRVHASGLGKLDKKRSFMIVSNHLSAFDHMGFMSMFHGMDVVAVSKKANEEMFAFGGWIKRAGFLAIDQTDMVSGTEVIAKAGSILKDNIASVMIAPEGTRNKNFPEPIMLPFHPGSFAMAYQAQAPIALFAIQNTNAVFGRTPLHMTDLYYDCVAVLEYDEYKDMSPSELSVHCHDLILARLEKKKARFYHLKSKAKTEE